LPQGGYEIAVKEIYNAVIEYNKDKVAIFVKTEIDKGTAISKIANEGLIAPLNEVGKRFSAGEIFVPEILRAAQAVKVGLELLRPLMVPTDSYNKGTIVIGTVKGDLHDIGKNLVVVMLEGAGFRVVDLGVDVNIERFIATAQEEEADIIALSALLTTTLPAMKSTIVAIKGKGLSAKTMVGGAPVNEAFAKKIGSDGYARDASEAVELARRLLIY
jgi:5-methyltetrahydrofolate--homocysteine methyltransferase